jgi:hypothetical protein
MWIPEKKNKAKTQLACLFLEIWKVAAEVGAAWQETNCEQN